MISLQAQVPGTRVPGQEKWRFRAGGAVTGSPALSEDGATLYVGSANRWFYALNTEDGTLKWSVRLRGPIVGSPTIDDDGNIYVPCDDGRLYSLFDDETEPGTNWIFRTPRRRVNSPAVDDDGFIYLGTEANRLYALLPEDGSILFSDEGTRIWPFVTGNRTGTPVIASEDAENAGTIYAVAGSKLFGVSAEGTEVSVFEPMTPMSSIPAISEEGIIYVGAHDNRLYALNPGGTTNDVRWTFNAGHNVNSSPVIGADGKIYVGAESGRLFCLSSNGVPDWSIPFRRPVRHALSIGADGTIYVGADNGRMHAITPEGEIRWEFRTRGPVRSAPAIDNQGVIYFGSNDKHVYAVWDDAIITEEHPWPMFRRDRLHSARASSSGAQVLQQPVGAVFDAGFIAENVTNGRTDYIVTNGATNLVVNSGENVLVSIITRGSAGGSLRWHKDGAPLSTTNFPSARDATLVLTNVQLSQAGAYTIVISNSSGSVTSSPFVLSVQGPPAFTVTTTNISLLAGGTLSLNLGAIGSEPISYQWLRNGTNLPGETRATLTRTNVTVADSGVYSLRASNQFGTSTSQDILVTVFAFTNDLTLAEQPLAAGQRHSLAILDDHTLWAWGLGNFGQLGDARAGSTTPGGTTQPFLVRPALIGTNGAGSTNAVWVSVTAGGRGAETSSNSVGGFSLGIQTNGTLWAWGQNDRGQLGLGNSSTITVPNQVGTASNWFRVEAGAAHVVALRTDGTLWAWGANGSGQLGLGTTNGTNIPVQVGTDAAWVEVRAGAFFNLARRADGTIWAWGANDHGQLGLGTNGTVLTPRRIGTAQDWTALSAGVAHSLALKSNATLWAWGSGQFGQLGQNSTNSSSVPVQVSAGRQWSGIEAGNYHSLAIATNQLYAWGANWFGQLGRGDFGGTPSTNDANAFIPERILPEVTWRSVDASLHTLALDTAGNVWAWGFNSHGQVGNGTSNNVSSGVMLNFTNSTSTSIETAPPIVNVQPTNVFSFTGSNVLFSVIATGAPPLRYQWYFNSTNLIPFASNSTATNSGLTLTNVQGNHAGFYRVLITNNFGNVTSSEASLTVTNPAGIIFFPDGTSFTNGSAPVITLQPSNQVVLTNATATFGVIATGSPPIFYQWRFGNNVMLTSSNRVTTNNTLVLTNVQNSDAGFYDVLVSNRLGVITSAVANLTVVSVQNTNEPPTLPFQLTSATGARIHSVTITETGVVARAENTSSAKNYIFEFTESLTAPEWTPLSTNRGPVTILVDPTLPPKRARFYRLREE